ncbi:carboxypeptidase regulatory-like domain-containing protein [Solicola sp. PLA-1-18]|uniref:carboxypeptidase regulatory-like domain-containing protein n=1 Tax=Solicola sp. PLA-1-18 TaxID=3380532 RepID=UPI003B782A0C
MRRTRATLVAATTSALLAFGLAPTFGTAAQAATTSVTGTISGAGGVSAAFVQVFSADDPGENVDSSYCDEDDGDTDCSTYSISDLPSGEYVVSVDAYDDDYDSYAAQFQGGATTFEAAEPFTYTAGDPAHVVDFALDYGQTVTGTVSTAAGLDVEDSTVELLTVDGKQVGFGYVGPDGEYEVTGVNPGSYKVSFNRDEEASGGFAAQYWNGMAESAGLAAATVLEVPELGQGVPPRVNATLTAGSSISGRVTDAAGNALRFSYVEAYTADGRLVSRSASTDNTGAFTVRGLNAGQYLVKVSGDTDQDSWFPGSVKSESQAKAVTVGATGSVAIGSLVEGGLDSINRGAAPTVVGTSRVGSTMSASPGTWGTPGLSFTYAWLRGGKATGRTGASYVLGDVDAGQRISFVVTARRIGFRDDARASSASAVVAKRTSAVSAKARGGKKKATVSVTVSVPGVASPGGTVTVKDGAKVVKSGVRLSGGKATVTLAKLKKGTHTFTVTYSGTAAINGGSARTTAKVKK